MSGTILVKSPVIPQWWNINLTSWSLTWAVPQWYYDWSETITASDTDLISSNVKNWVNIFWVTWSFLWNNNPLFSNIEFNASWLVVMADWWSWNYEPWFVTWSAVIWWNLYQVFNIMHRDDNSNSSEIWHYTVILKRTTWWVFTRYTQLRSTPTFTTAFTSNTTINLSWSIIQVHTAYWSWSYITFDTSTDVFSTVSWSLWSTMFWSDYTNYWINNMLSPFWATFNRTTLTWWILWSWMPLTASFWWNTYWWTHLCTHRNYWTWAWQSFQIAFSTKS